MGFQIFCPLIDLATVRTVTLWGRANVPIHWMGFAFLFLVGSVLDRDDLDWEFQICRICMLILGHQSR